MALILFTSSLVSTIDPTWVGLWLDFSRLIAFHQVSPRR